MDPEAEKGKDFAQQMQDRGQVTGGKRNKKQTKLALELIYRI